MDDFKAKVTSGIVDTDIQFKLFGEEQKGTVGIKIQEEGKWSCPFAAMVAYKVTGEQAIALCNAAEFDSPGLQGGIVGVRKSKLKGILDVGKWEFGFLGDVTPKDDAMLVFIVTDSAHVIWINCYVE